MLRRQLAGGMAVEIILTSGASMRIAAPQTLPCADKYAIGVDARCFIGAISRTQAGTWGELGAALASCQRHRPEIALGTARRP